MEVQTVPITRWNEITTIWKDNRWLYIIAGALLGILATPAIEQITGNLNELIGNLVPEAVGIIFTVLILNRQATNRTREELKTRLLNESRSPAAGIAVTALYWLRRKNWIDKATFKNKAMPNVNWEGAYIGDLNLAQAKLQKANFKNATLTLQADDGTSEIRSLNLSEANLSSANLEQTYLYQANLEQTYLYQANLREVNLSHANLLKANLGFTNLEQAYLLSANLEQADLGLANLELADLSQANLERADLGFANLEQTNLYQANLEQAIIESVNLKRADLGFANLKKADLYQASMREVKNINTALFDSKTVLPDAQILEDENGNILHDDEGNPIYDKYWTEDVDMTRYTNSDHPNFWEPDYLKPDYNGDDMPQWVQNQKGD